jgi:hypothetical protein
MGWNSTARTLNLTVAVVYGAALIFAFSVPAAQGRSIASPGTAALLAKASQQQAGSLAVRSPVPQRLASAH